MNVVSLRPQAKTPSSWVCSTCKNYQLQRRLHLASGPRNKGANPLLSPTRSINQTNRKASTKPTRAAKLPDGPARTRFAPSPTGYLHIGGLRTALFSYLLAKRTAGQFILRIEDTDQTRLVPDAEQRLCDDLQWAGLGWDEGPQIGGPYGPYRQSERNEIYQEHARNLLDEGSAYRCFCTPQTANEAKVAYVTSGCYQNCSSLAADEAQDRAESKQQRFTVRLRTPIDAHKRVYPDIIYGKIPRLKRSPSAPLAASEDDSAIAAADTILVRSDGTPTYHFANVVDDHLMSITHVIRGSEWMASTPLHYDIYSAFQWTPPQFAHVGLLVDHNKTKLSKRNTDLALDVRSMRDEHGVLAAPLVNFLALLGWSNPTSNDVMELRELAQVFDMKFTRGNAMVRTEKLWFLQKSHVARACEEAQAAKSFLPIKDAVRLIVEEVKIAKQIHASNAKREEELTIYCACVLLADSKSYQNAKQYVERNRYFFDFDASELPEQAQYYDKAGTLTAAPLEKIVQRLLAQDWASEPASALETPATPFARLEQAVHGALEHHVEETLRQHVDELPASLTAGEAENAGAAKKVLYPALMKYLREQLGYGLPGPSIATMMALLGYKECCRRLDVVPKEGGAGESLVWRQEGVGAWLEGVEFGDGEGR